MYVNNQNIALTYLSNLNPNYIPTINIDDNFSNTSRHNLKPKDQKILDNFSKCNPVIQFI